VKITSTTILRRDGTLTAEEYTEFRAAPRTTIVVTRARLEENPGNSHWRFTVFGYRKENSSGRTDRELTYSSRSGAALPAELNGLLHRMRYGPARQAEPEKEKP
jgi:hypothetical protein